MAREVEGAGMHSANSHYHRSARSLKEVGSESWNSDIPLNAHPVVVYRHHEVDLARKESAQTYDLTAMLLGDEECKVVAATAEYLYTRGQQLRLLPREKRPRLT